MAAWLVLSGAIVLGFIAPLVARADDAAPADPALAAQARAGIATAQGNFLSAYQAELNMPAGASSQIRDDLHNRQTTAFKALQQAFEDAKPALAPQELDQLRKGASDAVLAAQRAAAAANSGPPPENAQGGKPQTAAQAAAPVAAPQPAIPPYSDVDMDHPGPGPTYKDAHGKTVYACATAIGTGSAQVGCRAVAPGGASCIDVIFQGSTLVWQDPMPMPCRDGDKLALEGFRKAQPGFDLPQAGTGRAFDIGQAQIDDALANMLSGFWSNMPAACTDALWSLLSLADRPRDADVRKLAVERYDSLYRNEQCRNYLLGAVQAARPGAARGIPMPMTDDEEREFMAAVLLPDLLQAQAADEPASAVAAAPGTPKADSGFSLDDASRILDLGMGILRARQSFGSSPPATAAATAPRPVAPGKPHYEPRPAPPPGPVGNAQYPQAKSPPRSNGWNNCRFVNGTQWLQC